MPKKNLKLEIQKEIDRLAKSSFLKDFSRTMSDYDSKVRDFVNDMNLRGKSAKKKSRKQVDQFRKRLKKTRKEVEKTLRTLVDQEGKLLTKSYNELKQHLKKLAAEETSSQRSTPSKRKKKTTRRKKSGTKAKRARKTRKQSLNVEGSSSNAVTASPSRLASPVSSDLGEELTTIH